jgi:hypothetical protein
LAARFRSFAVPDPLWTQAIINRVPIIHKENEVVSTASKEVTDIKEKGQELKQMLKDLKATLETWKFSVEDTKEGMKVELHMVALVKQEKK